MQLAQETRSRDERAQVGESLYSPQAHMTYTILEDFGDGAHTLLGFPIIGPHYNVRWEDGIEQRLSCVQMYDDRYVVQQTREAGMEHNA